VATNTPTFPTDAAVQSLDVWLMLEDGDVLDRYSETLTDASWGRENSVYNGPASSDPHVSDLLAVLECGESHSVEFKPYIDLSRRDRKAQELVETVCAFANASGGKLLIGVTDYGEPERVDAEWRKAYGRKCGDNLECLQATYAADIRRLLRESVSEVSVSFECHQLAFRQILVVHVQPATELVYLLGPGDIFRRVGATNRKVRPIDAVIERSLPDA
jgi:predicted HTH transcriptional regulator